MDFVVPADHRVKTKESEKIDKYLDLARELREVWNMRVTVMPIVISALGTVSKRLQKGLKKVEIGGQIEIIHTTALLRSASIPRRVLETREDFLSLRLQKNTNSSRWFEELTRSGIRMIIILEPCQRTKKKELRNMKQIVLTRYERSLRAWRKRLEELEIRRTETI